jgi:hypothetical protein
MREPKGSRKIETEWVLESHEVMPGVVEEIVVRLTTSHYREAKAYRSYVARFKREINTNSGWTSEAHGSVLHNWNTLHQTPVARYAAKTIREAHAAALTVAAMGQEIEKAAQEALRTGGPAESPNR